MHNSLKKGYMWSAELSPEDFSKTFKTIKKWCLISSFHAQRFYPPDFATERGQFLHKRGFRPSTCIHATLFMLSNITETHSYPQIPDC